MRKIEIDKRELEDLYVQQKLNAGECADFFNCSETTIRRKLRYFNIYVRTSGESQKGRKFNKERKTNISKGRLERKSRLGYLNSQKTRDKISEAMKGKIPWVAGKTKKDYPQLSNSGVKKGNIPWMKDRHHTEKTKEKIRQANKGQIPWIAGKHHSQKSKDKMSESLKGHIAWNKNKKMTKEYIKNALTRRIPSSLEKKFQEMIDKHNLPYKYVGNGSFIIENCNPDFINTNNKKIAVEVYARYYKLKNHISIEKWKKERRKVFAKYGWHIVYFDETQVNKNTVLEILGEKTKCQ